MLNSSYVAEIKIGQGAKPGEGGHLPGKKVSDKVAAARNASPGTDLISPSNNHDLYSIEDLAELVDELKTVNPDLRVSVKVPVVPNIGTIGLGIAKAGADIITLSGFEGGTGAARQHALRHVGLPSDIGTRLVHRALMEAGIRNRVEIWADGGYRHAHDVIKLLHGRQPGRLRHPCHGLARLHDLPGLPAGHLPCRHRDPDRDAAGSHRARAEEVHAPGGRQCCRELRPLLLRDGRGGPEPDRRARLRAHPGPGRPLRPAGADRPPRRDRPQRADHAAPRVPRPRAGRPAGRRRGAGRGARRGGVGAGAPDPDGPEAGLGADRRARRSGCAEPRRAPRVPAGDRRQRPGPRRGARGRNLPRPHLRQRPRGL